jgi:hypothetical protein
MSEKRILAWMCGVGVTAAIGTGVLVYMEYGAIDESRAKVAALKVGIEASRKILTGTGALEREVIVLRETDEVIKEILPDEQDVNNLVRDLSTFKDEAGVQITGLKKKTQDNGRKEKNDFDKVGYQLNLEADAFQLLSFLDKIESHSRFMRVPEFKLNAAARRQVEDTGVPRHRISLDVETYVYRPQSGPTPVKIDGYARKRELLLGEINRRRQALQVPSYIYRGQRGRRDPWVDPRVPAHTETESSLSVDEQIRVVDDLVVRTQNVLTLWDSEKAAETLISQMTIHAQLEEDLAKLEEDVRRTLDEGQIRFVQSDRRLHNEVVTPINAMRQAMSDSQGNDGPSKESLRELVMSMRGNLDRGEYKVAQIAFDTVESRLAAAEADPLRQPLVAELRHLDAQAKDLGDFAKIQLDIRGVAVGEGITPTVLINDSTLGEGDLLGKELIIHTIKPGVIEFLFRGMILERRF